jgi:hypothetical protein
MLRHAMNTGSTFFGSVNFCRIFVGGNVPGFLNCQQIRIPWNV